MPKKTDVLVTNHFTIFTFTLLTKRAVEWVNEYVSPRPHDARQHLVCRASLRAGPCGRHDRARPQSGLSVLKRDAVSLSN